MEFKEGDKVKVITKNSAHFGRTGVVIRSMDDSTCFVNLSGDDKVGILTGFFVSELEPVDLRREALIELAETLDKARLQANNINGADGDIYRTISGSLYDVLGAIAGDEQVGYRIYSYVLDGSTVREALTLEEGN